MLNIQIESIKKSLLSHNVDIHNPNYKSSKEYLQIKDTKITTDNGCSMSLEKFIEQYLLSKQEIVETYDSIFDMGNPYELDDNECTDISVANEIILLGLSKKNIIEADEYEIVNNFVRTGGLIDRLKIHLDFDLDAFTKKDNQYKRERCKILYLFYILEHKYFVGTNVLEMFNNPSMENIDNLFMGMQTRNGTVIKTIKELLEKEMDLSTKAHIEKDIYEMVSYWENILNNAQYLMDFFHMNKYEYDFKETIDILYSKTTGNISQDISQYTMYPIEMLYLRILQHEYKGNLKDICLINKIEKNYDYNISPDQIEKMEELHDTPIDINNIEQYINENALRLSKYVYLKAKPNKEDVRRIRKAKEKIPKLFTFCKEAKLFLNVADIANELQLVSFLQAILLDDPGETFDYVFYGYQKYNKHMKRVQAALKTDDYVPIALQRYWVRKVTDRWYANLGRYDERIALRKFEMTCDNILMEILNQPCLDEMYKMHKFFLERVDEALITTSEQIWAVTQLEKHLQANCYKYIDPLRIIRYAFLYPPEINCTYCYLIEKIDVAIENHCSLIKERLTISTANGKGEMVFDLDIAFNHPNKQCILYDFNIISAQ